MAFTMSVAELISADTFGLLGQHPSWERVPLSLIAEVLNGAPFDSAFFSNIEGIPLVRIRDVQSGVTNTYYTGEFENAFLVNQGDLLVGMDGDFNTGHWGKQKALLNQRVCKITANEEFYDKKLLSLLLPGYLAAINANTSSVTVKHLSSKTISEIDLPLPPRAEQTRIVAKLEELLSDLDAGVAELKAAQKKLAQYRQSLLKAAVEGTLTADWRTAQQAKRQVTANHTENTSELETGAQLLERILTERRARWEAKQLEKFAEQGKTPPKDWQKKYPEPVQPDTRDLPELPEGWVWASVDQVGEVFLGKMLDKTKHISGSKLPYLRNINVRWGTIDFSDMLEMFFKNDELDRYGLATGDVLVCEGGEPGRAAVYYGESTRIKYQKALHRVRFFEVYEPELLVIFLEYAAKNGKLESSFTGSTIKHFTKESFLQLAIPLPPLGEQEIVVHEVECSLAAIYEQENAIDFSLKQSAAQRQNILRAAFAGELVPQDPRDEPASVLLERIRAERAAQAKQPKPRKTKPKKEIATVASQLIDVLAEAGDWLEAQEAFRRCGVADGALTERIEELYAELRKLDKDRRLAVEAITDEEGRKTGDRIKLLAG